MSEPQARVGEAFLPGLLGPVTAITTSGFKAAKNTTRNNAQMPNVMRLIISFIWALCIFQLALSGRVS